MAFLPNIDRAVVETAKVTDYLLSDTHPQGSAKAQFFVRFGFDANRPEEFKSAILMHARQHEVAVCERSRFGVKYVIDGPLEAPDGRSPPVRAVWFIEEVAPAPRLVTVVPMRNLGQ